MGVGEKVGPGEGSNVGLAVGVADWFAVAANVFLFSLNFFNVEHALD